jgi:hypothetical protein
MIHQQERFDKSQDTGLMRNDDTLDTSSPSDKVKVKNIEVLQDKFRNGSQARCKKRLPSLTLSISMLWKRQWRRTLLKKLQVSWNWRIDLEEPCPGINQKHVVVKRLKPQLVRRYALRLCRRWRGNIL